MNPDYEPGAFTVRLIDTETNEVIGTTKTLDAEVKREYELPKEYLNFDRSYSMTMENCEFNTTALNEILLGASDPTFIVKAKSKTLNKLLHIRKHTKKKRIKKKVQKRINKLDHPIYHDGIEIKSSQINIL